MFKAALFTIVKAWKQPKGPLTNECIKIQYIYNGILLSHKKNERFPFTAAYLKLPQYCKSAKVQFKNKKESLIDEVIDKEIGPERRSDPPKVTAELGPNTICRSY